MAKTLTPAPAHVEYRLDDIPCREGQAICPTCGRIEPVTLRYGWTGQWCKPCANSGHCYRLMTIPELEAAAIKWGGLGYPVAAKQYRQRAAELAQ